MAIKHNKQSVETHTNNYANNSLGEKIVSIDNSEVVGHTSDVDCRRRNTPLPTGAISQASTFSRSQKAEVQSGYLPAVNVYKIYNETMNQLSWLDGHVREGKELEQALRFCRYVIWSGIIELCNYHATVEPGLKISGANLHTRAKQLQMDVQDRFRTNNLAPAIEMTELEKLNRKLDLIAGRISQISPPKNDTAELGSTSPELHVIQGGVLS